MQFKNRCLTVFWSKNTPLKKREISHCLCYYNYIFVESAVRWVLSIIC